MNNERKSILLYHVSNIIGLSAIGYIIFALLITPELRKFLDYNQFLLLGIILLSIVVRSAARKLSQKTVNPLFANKRIRQLYYAGLICFLVGALFYGRNNQFIYLSAFGFLLELIALIFSFFVQTTQEEHSDPSVIDDFTLNND